MRRTIIPTRRYDDAPAAIEFPVPAFGVVAAHGAPCAVRDAEDCLGDVGSYDPWAEVES